MAGWLIISFPLKKDGPLDQHYFLGCHRDPPQFPELKLKNLLKNFIRNYEIRLSSCLRMQQNVTQCQLETE